MVLGELGVGVEVGVGVGVEVEGAVEVGAGMITKTSSAVPTLSNARPHDEE